MDLRPGFEPFLKWAGGKRRVLDRLLPAIPPSIGTYFEPFVGGGSVFLALAHAGRVVIGDSNRDLIEAYEVVRDSPEKLVEVLSSFEVGKDFYLEIRQLDRIPDFRETHDEVFRAARFIFLNRAGFNGLYRVNRRGEFNVPFGSRSGNNPSSISELINEKQIFRVSSYLQGRGFSGQHGGPVEMRIGEFDELLADAKPGDFVYLDPPYDPISKTSSFVAYNSLGFDKGDQERVLYLALQLNRKNVNVLISNSATDFIKEDLFKTQTSAGRPFRLLAEFPVRRSVSASAGSRVDVNEVLISNYELPRK